MNQQLTTIDQTTGEILRPDEGLAAPLEELVKRMRDYQAAVKALLTPDDYQRIGPKEFKKKSAWRKLATAFGVTVQIVDRVVAYDDNGRIHHAEFVVRAVARNGRTAEAWAGASIADREFSHDQDVAATAQTRATSRAISDLIGAGEVSAEEMADEPARQRPAPRAEPRRARYDAGMNDMARAPQRHPPTVAEASAMVDVHQVGVFTEETLVQAAPAAPQLQRISGEVVGVSGTMLEPLVTVESQGKRLSFGVSTATVALDLIPTADHIGCQIVGKVRKVDGDPGYEIVEVTSLQAVAG